MENDILTNFDMPLNQEASIKVIGVGGGGGNAVNHMCRRGIKDVDFVVCNTDSQALANSPVTTKVQLGSSLTEGRGAGNKPEVGRKAAIENIEDVKRAIGENTKMVFITAGMGGGTGTGAGPVIAEACRELDLLTIGIVTIPFRNEGKRRIQQAIEGIQQLEGIVDSLLVINNEKIREMYGDFKISEAFAKADDVLATAAKGIAEIITVHGYINVDFADVETVMRQSGVAIMGSAIASGENRAIKAVEEALNSPLLNNNDINGARNILLNITSATTNHMEIGQITIMSRKTGRCRLELGRQRPEWEKNSGHRHRPGFRSLILRPAHREWVQRQTYITHRRSKPVAWKVSCQSPVCKDTKQPPSRTEDRVRPNDETTLVMQV